MIGMQATGNNIELLTGQLNRITCIDPKRFDELEEMIEWKDSVLRRFLSITEKKNIPGGELRGLFFRALKLHQAKIAPLVKERNDLLSVHQLG